MVLVAVVKRGAASRKESNHVRARGKWETLTTLELELDSDISHKPLASPLANLACCGATAVELYYFTMRDLIAAKRYHFDIILLSNH